MDERLFAPASANKLSPPDRTGDVDDRQFAQRVSRSTSMTMKPSPPQSAGFALHDILLTIASAAVLVAAALGMTTRETSQRAICYNNLRQLGVAALEFAEEHDGELPRRGAGTNTWLHQLKTYYVHDVVLQCPAKGANEVTLHSYLMNSFADYFATTLPPGDFGRWPRGMSIDAIDEPANTLVFGEKVPASFHAHMDFLQNGDDVSEVDQGRHFAPSGELVSGASNHAFSDGSVRLLSFGKAFDPVNLWCVVPEYRTNSIVY